jgi:restriction system protein
MAELTDEFGNVLIDESGIGLTDEIPDEARRAATLSVSSVIIPERSTAQGILIRSTSLVWGEIVQALGNDWTLAYRLTPEKWEEIVAGAFKKAQYDDVTLTPRSGDHGRDVIAIKRGIGCVKIIGSVKRYAPGHLVGYDDIARCLASCRERETLRRGSSRPPRIFQRA